ncbi:MAG: 50S ribosomal protein L18 [Chlamydiales bacterium]|nr:50S ribosomal protein L18 [Chlamydiales bacterium]
MIKDLIKRNKVRKNRVFRVRKTLKGDASKPRMSVTKSNKHLFVQLINDEEAKTIVSLGTVSKELQGTEFNKKSKEAARHIGEQIAQRAKAMGVDAVIFDRGRFKYHGIIAELANAARKAGLQF